MPFQKILGSFWILCGILTFGLGLKFFIFAFNSLGHSTDSGPMLILGTVAFLALGLIGIYDFWLGILMFFSKHWESRFIHKFFWISSLILGILSVLGGIILAFSLLAISIDADPLEQFYDILLCVFNGGLWLITAVILLFQKKPSPA